MSLKVIIGLATILVTLVACQEKEKSPNFSLWQRNDIAEREVGGKSVPTKYILDCRRIDTAENVHYYYSVVANPTFKENKLADGSIESIYTDAQFSIDIYTSSTKGEVSLKKGLVLVDVDFKIVESPKKEFLAFVTANRSTATDFQENYENNPYFNYIKEGQEIMTLDEIKGVRSNITKMDLPGLTKGDALECR